jgi:hypothetical protein
VVSIWADGEPVTDSLRFLAPPGARCFCRPPGFYQQAVIELGFLHSRYLRGTPPPDFAERGQEYVARIAEVRPSVSFPGQVVPAR